MNAQRYARIREMLAKRQPDLTVCMEQVHKHHNVSAIIRTTDAVSVREVNAVWPGNRMLTMASSAAGSHSWVEVKTHRTIEDAVVVLKQCGMQILVPHLSNKAVDFREIDYTHPTFILMGQKKTGITQQALDLADRDIIIQLICMVQSLNASVASALILYEAQSLLFESSYPVLARVATCKGLPYPHVNNEGQIDADPTWWVTMQASE